MREAVTEPRVRELMRALAAEAREPGRIYLVGGTDGSAPKGETYWAVPDSNGNIPSWSHLAASDLPPEGLAGSAAVVTILPTSASHTNVFVLNTGSSFLSLLK